MANLNIKLVKSLNGRLEKHIATAKSMGLRKIGDTNVLPDRPEIRGMLARVPHLIEVTENAEGTEN